MKKLDSRFWSYITAFVGFFLVDRLTKLWASDLVGEYTINQFLFFELTFNPGISWGILGGIQSYAFKMFLNAIIVSIVSILWSYARTRYTHHRNISGEVMVIAGALSNCYDRIEYAGVIDFIWVHYNQWYFPAFNIADMLIVGGIALMVLTHYRDTA